MLSRTWPKSAVLFLVGMWTIQAHAAESVTSEKSLQTFLQGYLNWHGLEDRTAQYSAVPVLLDDRTPMHLVYISGRDSCGTGGCTALLLKPDRARFKIVNRFTLARLPIHVLPSLTKGWHDITMPVSGGGVPYHIAILRYNGSKYPSNPSVAPTLRLPKTADSGTELSLKPVGEFVYP